MSKLQLTRIQVSQIVQSSAMLTVWATATDVSWGWPFYICSKSMADDAFAMLLPINSSVYSNTAIIGISCSLAIIHTTGVHVLLVRS